MMPQRQLHLNPQTFGTKAADLMLNASLMTRAFGGIPLRPFGGGTTLWPGRSLAKKTALAFNVFALHIFDIVLDPPSQPFPIRPRGTQFYHHWILRKGATLE
jgi:hypothetical protein